MHNNTLRRVSTHASTTTTSSRITPSIHTRRSTDSRILEQVLQDGDEIGPGRFLLDQPISVVHARSDVVPNLRVLRKLATGSYAVVYLVQEIVPPTTASNFLNLSEDDDSPPLTPATAAAPAQGRLFALKCLEKHAQDQEAQLLEATIHQSLPVHQNIVTLWSTLETESYLLLLLDYVPGEDLFYFLEQFRDYDESHLDRDGSSTPSSAPPISTAGLAWLQPSQLLSYHRLRLVASMFSQMCEAVAHCHRHGVFHRDIKPENFMVTDTRILDPVTGEYKRSVTVKLTDFGLATRDPESGDMDCGSAPYMSFECRNFITPMYATAPADVWSLGIVLLNMLYHANPWMSSAFGACQSFDSFLREPIPFFMDRFPGMTPAVAEFFARRVFCLLEVPSTGDNSGSMFPLSPHYANNVGRRITAGEFGLWARDLQLHLGPSARRTPALAFQPTPSPIPSSSTPSSRPRSPGETSLTSTTRLMAPSVSQPGTRTPSPSVHARPPVPVHPATAHNGNNGTDDTPYQSDSEEEDVGRSRTTSSKRRKRAPRGNKAQTMPTTPATSTATTAPPNQHLSSAAEYAATIRAISTSNDDRLRELVTRSEMVAREASKLTKTPPSTTAPLHTTTPSAPIINPPTSTVTTARSTPELRTKRSTKWTDIFRRDSGSDQEVPTSAQVAQMDAERESLSSPVQVLRPATLSSSASVGNLSTKQTGTAKNVSNLLKSLDSTAPASNPASTVRSGDVLDDGISWSGNSNGRSSSFSSRGRRKERRGGDRESQRAPSPGSIFSVSTTSTANSTSNRNRGQSAPNQDRRTRSKSPTQAAIDHFNMLMPTSGDSAPPAVSPSGHTQRLVYVPESPPPPVPIVPEEHRGFVPVPAQVQQQQVDVSPVAGQSNRRSYAPSIASVSTTTTSSSAFTAFSGKNSRWGRYSNSNASVRSVSTAATSVSSSSTNWRNEANPPLPSNIKPMKGIPKELDQIPQLPRHMQSRPKDNSRNRRRPPSAPTSPTAGSSFGLDTISEKPKKSAMKQPKAPVPPLPSSSYEEPVNPGLQRLNDAIRGSEFSGFDPSIKSFGRGGPGLQIDPEIANAASGYPAGANVAVPPHPQNVENAPERPVKTPTRSRLWSWRR